MIANTAPITFQDIQTEFGGENPIGLNEYYRGGTYVPLNAANTIPLSGSINALQFLGSYLPVEKGVLVSRLISEDDANTTNTDPDRLIRNFLTSSASAFHGNETNVNLNVNNTNNGMFLTNTGVNGVMTFDYSNTSFFSANTLFTGVDPYDAFNRSTCATIIVRSSSASVGNPAVTISVNGGLEESMTYSHHTTDSPNASIYMYHYMNKFTSLISLEFLFRKRLDNGTELDNLQEVYVLPGKWNYISSSLISDSTSPYAINGSIDVLNHDFIMLFTRMGLANTGFPPTPVLSGVNYHLYLNRTSRYSTLSTRSLSLFSKANGLLNFSMSATNPINLRTSIFRLEHT